MADHNEPLVKPELISSSTGLSPRCIHDTTASVSISIKTLSKKLKNMVQVYISKRENVSKLETFLFTLKSRRLRSLSSSLEFLSSGGVDSLLELARSLAKDNEKESSLLNLVWGTIANVCSFDKKIQQKVHYTHKLHHVKYTPYRVLYYVHAGTCYLFGPLSGHPLQFSCFSRDRAIALEVACQLSY